MLGLTFYIFATKGKGYYYFFHFVVKKLSFREIRKFFHGNSGAKRHSVFTLD